MGGKDVYFFTHTEEERREKGGYSYENEHEAKMIVRFARFLRDQGLEDRKITIISMYDAQVRLIEESKKIFSICPLDEVKICTVDGFQGILHEIITL